MIGYGNYKVPSVGQVLVQGGKGNSRISYMFQNVPECDNIENLPGGKVA